jgi:branched-chain amino acid transport system ATP-binding protein
MSALLEISGLSRRFGGLIAVRDIAMEVAQGSVHGLIGPNGAGKTTLLNLKLFRDMSVLENVMVGMHGETHCEIWHALLRTRTQATEEAAIVERAREALEFVGLLHLADIRADELPYGSQRLVEIARATVARPKLLLLDEPAAGLNGAESRRLVDLIRAIRSSGTTILLVEHHMDVVMPSCDCITVLNYGQRLANGSPAEIRAHPEVIKAYLGGGLKRRERVKPDQQAELFDAAS